MNKTALVCASFSYKYDFYNVLLNVLRFGLLIPYVIWIIIFLKCKELHNHQMVLMTNLALMGIFYCLTGILSFFYTSCDELSIQTCTSFVIISIFKYYYGGYSLSALSIHRLGTILIPNRTKKIKVLNLIIVFAIVWIIPLLLAMIQVYAFKSKIYFDRVIADCVYDASGQISGFIFFLVLSYLLPNLLLIAFDVYELKKTRENLAAIGRNEIFRESLRTIFQLRVLFFMYQLSCISNLFILYISNHLLIQNELVALFDIFRWFFHVSPIGLLYSHPILIKNYKRLWNLIKNRNSISV